MQPAITLKKKLASKDLVVGMLITNTLSLEWIELAMEAGMDYVIVDIEHTGHGDVHVADACRLGRMSGFPVLVRPARTDMESVRLATDMGPCGLMLPMIETVAQLDEVRAGLYMPPRGRRRPGGHGNWWVRDYNYSTWKKEVEDNWVILAQIESPLGLSNVEAIARHEVVTSMAVGPYDLSARLGCCFNPDHADLQAALKKIRDTADSVGKPMWMIGDGPTLVKRGYRFLCVCEPTFFLRAGVTALVKQVRESTSTAGAEKTFVP